MTYFFINTKYIFVQLLTAITVCDYYITTTKYAPLCLVASFVSTILYTYKKL